MDHCHIQVTQFLGPLPFKITVQRLTNIPNSRVTIQFKYWYHLHCTIQLTITTSTSLFRGYQLNLRLTPNSGSQSKGTLALPKHNSKANCHFQVTVQIPATSPGNPLPLFDHNLKAHCSFHITSDRVGPIPRLQFKVSAPISYQQSATHCHFQTKYHRPISTVMLPLRIASIRISQFEKPTAHSH
jgi:hypothetical protein